MADYFVVECGTETLTGLEVRVSKGTAELVRAVRSTQPTEPGKNWDHDTPLAIENIRRTRKESGVQANRIVLLLPREALVARQLDLPDVPDDELPDLVRFQAAVRSAAPVESLALDYIPLPAGPHPGRRVLVFTHDRARIAEWQKGLAAEEMELAGCFATPIAMAEFADRIRTVADDETRLLVFQRGAKIELTLVDERMVVFSHGTQLPPGTGMTHVQPLQAELIRTTVSLGQLHPGVEIGQVSYLCDGEPDETVVGLLEQRFPSKVSIVRGSKPLAAAGALSGNPPATLVGAGLSLGTPAVPRLDLVNPRKPAPKTDGRRKQILRAACGVGLVAIIALGVWWRAVLARDAQIQELNDSIAALSDTLKQGEPALKETKAVDRWYTGVAAPLTTLDSFQQVLPGTDRLYFAELHLEPDLKIGGRPRISGVARARTAEDKQELEQRLRDKGYEVPPNVATTGKKDPDYPVEFSVNVAVPAPPAGKSGT
ncbi:hypothetical protein [Planctomyces sp. SH-PL14]|uniref:hypothetical protein n=1 Tax=Planctomyces sp. SH-PL14 TaxID=1632864 RepID=UPI00078C7634|nr:hypothetical protein [Planctomyces sp. SH-PL14]AMV17264.1 hypothetical protein VT03_05190 [Planctomyces sp. SH-PL14]